MHHPKSAAATVDSQNNKSSNVYLLGLQGVTLVHALLSGWRRRTSEKKIRQGRGYDAKLVIGESEETLWGRQLNPVLC